MDQPKYLNEYINQLLFDMGQIGPQHLQAIRIGLTSLYRRIKYVNVYADLNNNIIEFSIKFKWWSFLTNKRKFLLLIKNKLINSLPKSVKITEVGDKHPTINYVDYDIKIGILKNKDNIKWINDGKEENRS